MHELLILNVLGHLETKGNHKLLEAAAQHIPPRLLFTQIAHPYSPLDKVKEIWVSKQILVPKMAEAIAEDPNLFDEGLERAVLAGQFGQPEEVFTFLLNYLSDEENLPAERSEDWKEDYQLLIPILASGLSLDVDSEE